jgi:hypothetical protein
MPTVEILGVHPLQVTQELFEQALADKYGHEFRHPEDRRAAERAVRDELESAVLIEACVKDRDACLDLADFGQGDQAAYDEAYLSEDGTIVVGRFMERDKVQSRDVRVAFWLHYYDAAQSIRTSYGPVSAPPPTPMPERLSKLMNYLPVD